VAPAKARLSKFGRRLRGGWTVVTAAEASGVSRATAYKLVGRFEAEGVTGLADRSSRPHHSPRRTAARLERRAVNLRTRSTAALLIRVGSAASATTRSTPASTTTLGWPTARSCPTSRVSPVLPSSTTLATSSPATESLLSG